MFYSTFLEEAGFFQHISEMFQHFSEMLVSSTIFCQHFLNVATFFKMLDNIFLLFTLLQQFIQKCCNIFQIFLLFLPPRGRRASASLLRGARSRAEGQAHGVGTGQAPVAAAMEVGGLVAALGDAVAHWTVAAGSWQSRRATGRWGCACV
jgi:hypothetical protein